MHRLIYGLSGSGKSTVLNLLRQDCKVESLPPEYTLPGEDIISDVVPFGDVLVDITEIPYEPSLKTQVYSTLRSVDGVIFVVDYSTTHLLPLARYELDLLLQSRDEGKDAQGDAKYNHKDVPFLLVLNSGGSRASNTPEYRSQYVEELDLKSLDARCQVIELNSLDTFTTSEIYRNFIRGMLKD
jgi:hypothetical protein